MDKIAKISGLTSIILTTTGISLVAKENNYNTEKKSEKKIDDNSKEESKYLAPKIDKGKRKIYIKSIYDRPMSPNFKENLEKSGDSKFKRNQNAYEFTGIDYVVVDKELSTNHEVIKGNCAWDLSEKYNKEELKHNDNIKQFVNTIYCVVNDKDKMSMHPYGTNGWGKNKKRNPHLMHPGDDILIPILAKFKPKDLPKWLSGEIGKANFYHLTKLPNQDKVVIFNFKSGKSILFDEKHYYVLTPNKTFQKHYDDFKI